MKLIDTLMPTIVHSVEDFDFKYMTYQERNDFTKKWHFDNRIYAKIYFQCRNGRLYDVDSWKSVICKSKDYFRIRGEAASVSDYIIEFYTDKDFEINPIWEKIF